ncbi:MAG: hypothetical protein DCC55_01340 [Chloroflexi bacterium]|nr:MAG: hypothetical protein DCC55_01340 [Chloroflexota bacterium]
MHSEGVARRSVHAANGLEQRGSFARLRSGAPLYDTESGTFSRMIDRNHYTGSVILLMRAGSNSIMMHTDGRPILYATRLIRFPREENL